MDTLDAVVASIDPGPLGEDTEAHRQRLENAVSDELAYAKYAIAEKVARAILDYRIPRGLSQKQAAKKLGMKVSALCRLERGDHVPNVQTMLRVAKATGTDLIVDFAVNKVKKP